MTASPPEAAQEEPEPEPGPTWRDIRQTWAGLAQRFDQLLTDAEAGRADPDLARRWTILKVDLREANNARAAQAFAERFTDSGAAAAPGRHRAPDGLADVIRLPQTRPQPRIRARVRPRAAHGIAPAGIAALLAGHGSRHALSLKLAGLTAAASIVGGVATYTVQTLPDQHAAPAPALPAAAVSAPATPVYAPRVTATPRVMGRHRKRITPPAPALTAPATPAPSPSQASPPAPAPGVLNVQAAAITLTQTTPGQYTGQLTLYATGGPARWQVGWLGTSSTLKFSQSFGVIPAGESVTVTVTVDAAQVTPGGSWQVTLAQPGQPDQVVAVSAAG